MHYCYTKPPTSGNNGSGSITSSSRYILLLFSLQENPLENLNTAFDVAATHLDIPRMLVAEGVYVFVPRRNHVFCQEGMQFLF